MASSGDSNVTLFTHKFSPFAQRAQVAMVAKGISFKPVYVDLTVNKPEEFLKANPIHGKVPTLVHDGNSVCESLIILEYLEEAWPETTPLMPKDAFAKSKSRFWADYIVKNIPTATKVFGSKPNTPEREATVAEMTKFYKTLEEAMTEYSAEGPFFTGDKFGYLDVVLVPLASWSGVVGKTLQAPLPGPDVLPRLQKWMKAIKEQKAYKEVIAADEEFVEYFFNLVKRRAAAAAAAEAAANGK